MSEIRPDTSFDVQPYLKGGQKEKQMYGDMSGEQGMTAEKVKAIASARIAAREKEKAELNTFQKEADLSINMAFGQIDACLDPRIDVKKNVGDMGSGLSGLNKNYQPETKIPYLGDIVSTETKPTAPAPNPEAKPAEALKPAEPVKPAEKLVSSEARNSTEGLLENAKVGTISPLKGMPGVSFIKYNEQKTMNETWGKITAYVEQNTVNFSTEKSWNYAGGHDLSSQSIANYFNEFSTTLSSQEKSMRDELVNQGIISKNPNNTYSGVDKKAILVMFYPEGDTNKGMREMVKGGISHELAHGLYFTNPEFKKLTDSVWNSLSPDEKAQLSKGLSSSYSNTEFHATEFLSYILFTGDDKGTIVQGLVGGQPADKNTRGIYNQTKYNEFILPLREKVKSYIGRQELSPEIQAFINQNSSK